jgi:hypothetical protein
VRGPDATLGLDLIDAIQQQHVEPLQTEGEMAADGCEN